MTQTNFHSDINAEAAFAASRKICPDILTSVRIGAEVRRVLYALATPEYMEAWMQLPEVERVECHTELRSFDKFRIDLFSSGKRQGSIFGSCHLAKPNRVTYLWERDFAGRRAGSVVEVCLLGDPAGCTLKLRHSRLSNQGEIEWYSTMWRRSLAALCTLMEGVDAGPTNRSVARSIA